MVWATSLYRYTKNAAWRNEKDLALPNSTP